jgi:predicted transcriptional regulator of viral defense system
MANYGRSMPMQKHVAGDRLSDLVDSEQARGRYVLTRDQVQKALGVSDDALKKAAGRLVAKRRLAVPRRGFYVVVPVEYRHAGAPPPSWFVDELMKFHGQPYYVGILSAAALHGAAHQQPQEFQVVTNAQLRPVVAGRARIRFFRKQRIESIPVVQMKTVTGTMRVSVPEATALDLLRYFHAAGHLGNVVTVLAELAPEMNPERLAELARAEGNVPIAQRLGYLLESVGARAAADPLAAWVGRHRPRFVPLRSDRSAVSAERNARWRVLINERVESEA